MVDMRNVLFIWFLLTIVSSLKAQEVSFSPATKIATINTGADEFQPCLSKDGKELYFVRAFCEENIGGLNSGSDIWKADFTREEPLTPMNTIGKWNNRENNALIGIHSNNNTFYLLNAYNNKTGIAFSKRLDGDFTKPEVIEIDGLSRDGFVGFYVNPTYDVLLISMQDDNSIGEEDIYVSLKGEGGSWQKPINLGSSINTTGFEISPFLSQDKRTLYFASNGHEGFGSADIYKSERLHNSWTVWSKPENLGSGINSISFDAYFSMYEDSICFYSSDREGQMDIYQALVFKEMGKSIISYKYLTTGEVLEIFGFLPDKVIHFDNDSYFTISPQDKEALWLIANKVKELENVYILVDNYGKGIKEQTMMNRFSQVSYFLQSRGVSLSRIVMNDSIKTSDVNKIELNFFSR